MIQAVARADFDQLLFSSAHVLCGNLENTVRVNQEFYFDAREARGGRRDFKCKAREGAAIFREFAFALQNVDIDAGLIVDASRIHLLRARRNRRVAGNDFSDGSTIRFNAQRERGDVKKEHVRYAAVENIGLYSSA